MRRRESKTSLSAAILSSQPGRRAGRNEEHGMPVAVARKQSLMSVADFLGFLRSRPDEECWELFNGIPMMMTPPTIAHQRIASNLERYLNDALRERKPAWRADREIGVVLKQFGHYRPEPEIAVVDADIDAGQRHADRFY